MQHVIDPTSALPELDNRHRGINWRQGKLVGLPDLGLVSALRHGGFFMPFLRSYYQTWSKPAYLEVCIKNLLV